MSGGPLDGVDTVRWHRLHHAYGAATDVPDQLRALRGPDPDRRGAALSRLSGSVYHQGTRWQASQAVVPFLVALVDDAGTPDRAAVLELLRKVAIGDRRDDELPFDPARAFAAADAFDSVRDGSLLLRFFAEEDEFTEDEIGVLDGAAVSWAADSYFGAAACLDAVVSWVSDPDDEVAARAAALTAWFQPTAARVAALVAVPEGRTRVRASANLVLAHTPSADPRVDLLLRELTGSDSETVAVTAAVAEAYRRGGAVSEEALSVLAGVAERDDLAAVAGWDRALRGFVMLALRRLGLG
ncbi:hypothetical protein QEZ54_16680 [Catellatospora sp. KI3]|uniref:hypothetical protein n=1 Tax=Catellatospora sp. KI3 TaxID=3041620 RepID=UPI0024822A88|nr:hypothetical protein [Catellatospora sp. KI3]MDI1462610.1 hypothetical protein [Catellatospora sp. KI3]